MSNSSSRSEAEYEARSRRPRLCVIRSRGRVASPIRAAPPAGGRPPSQSRLLTGRSRRRGPAPAHRVRARAGRQSRRRACAGRRGSGMREWLRRRVPVDWRARAPLPPHPLAPALPCQRSAGRAHWWSARASPGRPCPGVRPPPLPALPSPHPWNPSADCASTSRRTALSLIDMSTDEASSTCAARWPALARSRDVGRRPVRRPVRQRVRQSVRRKGRRR